jgi:hypothetical protein
VAVIDSYRYDKELSREPKRRAKRLRPLLWIFNHVENKSEVYYICTTDRVIWEVGGIPPCCVDLSFSEEFDIAAMSATEIKEGVVIFDETIR